LAVGRRKVSYGILVRIMGGMSLANNEIEFKAVGCEHMI